MALMGIGPTELRILLAGGTLYLYVEPVVTVFGERLLLFDVAGVVTATAMSAALAVTVARNTTALYLAEPLPSAGWRPRTAPGGVRVGRLAGASRRRARASRDWLVSRLGTRAGGGSPGPGCIDDPGAPPLGGLQRRGTRGDGRPAGHPRRVEGSSRPPAPARDRARGGSGDPAQLLVARAMDVARIEETGSLVDGGGWARFNLASGALAIPGNVALTTVLVGTFGMRYLVAERAGHHRLLGGELPGDRSPRVRDANATRVVAGSMSSVFRRFVTATTTSSAAHPTWTTPTPSADARRSSVSPPSALRCQGLALRRWVGSSYGYTREVNQRCRRRLAETPMAVTAVTKPTSPSPVREPVPDLPDGIQRQTMNDADRDLVELPPPQGGLWLGGRFGRAEARRSRLGHAGGVVEDHL